MATSTIINPNRMGNMYFSSPYINVSTKFYIPSVYRGMLIITDSSAVRCGIYNVVSTNTGIVYIKEVSSATDVTLSTETNALLITISNGSRQLFSIGNAPNAFTVIQ